MSNTRAREAQYRQTDAGRMARKMYDAQPQVRQMKAVRRAVKRHQTPPAVQYGPGKALGGR